MTHGKHFFEVVVESYGQGGQEAVEAVHFATGGKIFVGVCRYSEVTRYAQHYA
jgi:hypothetical protein